MRKLLAASALTLALAVPAAAQETPKFQEKLDVNLVLLDVTVTDKKGNQILGLTKDDFILKEDGEQKQIDSADYFTNRRLLTSPEDKAAFKVERVREERYFIIMLHRPPDPTFRQYILNDVLQAKRASLEFVEKEMLPEDRVAVVGYDIRLKVFSDFTSDKAALKKAIDEAVTFSNGISIAPEHPAENSIFAHMSVPKMINETGRIYDGIELLAKAVEPIPARKVLLLFSPGIGEASDFSREIPENDAVWFNPMLAAIQRSNVTVYPMNLLRNVRYYAAEQNLMRLASETGGEYYRQSTSFTIPLRQIENVNNGYYLLSYYSKKDSGDKLKSLKVSLKNPEFTVLARRGR